MVGPHLHVVNDVGFKLEPQDRMQKVHTEIDTLWQVSFTCRTNQPPALDER